MFKIYGSQIDAEANLDRFFRFYIEDRPHNAVDGDVAPLEIDHGDHRVALRA